MSRRGQGPFIGSLTRLVWQWVRHEIHTAVAAAGYDDLSPAHVAVFRNPTPEGMRPSDLADEMQITKQSVNELLGHLERRGYLVREPDLADNRSRRIRLTARGRQLEDVVWRAAEDAERKTADLIGDGRMGELRQTLSELVARLGLVGEDPGDAAGDGDGDGGVRTSATAATPTKDVGGG